MHYKTEITNKIIDALEKGVKPWQCPFERCLFPVNYKTKHKYNGINTMLLWLTANLKSYTSNYWIGFAQAKSLKLAVKKGEKATKIIVCMLKEEEGDDDKVITPFFKSKNIFNLDQVDGFELENENSNISSLKEFRSLLKAVKPNIKHQGERAYFSLIKDVINIPFKSKFKSNEGYYSTLFHELIHWTGHESRLNRLKDNKVNNRAFEELVAEIGASFLCAEFGITPDIDNTSSYVASWLKELKNDRNYIFQACKEASSSISYLKSFVVDQN